MNFQVTTTRVLTFISILYFLLFLSHFIYLQKTVYGDGLYYFAWLRSVVIDHNINFTNDYQLFGISAPPTSLNIPGNKYAIGPALLWLPWYLWTHLIIGGQGIEWPYQLIVGLQSLIYTLIGFYFLFLALRRYFPKKISLLAISFIALTTNLLFYGAIDVVNSHSLSFFTTAFFINLLTKPQKNWLLLGIVLGLSALIRLQDIVIALLLLSYLNFKALIPLLLGFTGIFLWQPLAWYLLYNTWSTSPYLIGGEGFNFFSPQILGVLFNSTNGLLLWTPSVILALVGLFHLPASLARLSKLFPLVIFIQLYLVASWSTWWQGASFSGRMFISTLPLIAFGFAGIFDLLKAKFHWSKKQFILLLSTLSLTNISWIIFFLLRT